MATTTTTAYTASIATALTTELNSLANSANCSASSAIDNTSNLNLFMDVMLNIAAQGSARSAGAVVIVYAVHALDGTTYDDVLDSTCEVVAVFTLDAATTARQVTRRGWPMPPGLFKLFVRNITGQAFAASASTLKYRMHNVKTV